MLAKIGVDTAENEPLKMSDYMQANLPVINSITCKKNEFTCNPRAMIKTIHLQAHLLSRLLEFRLHFDNDQTFLEPNSAPLPENDDYFPGVSF